ncbi:hypothetical protein ES703_54637 [subsurface metagenome]
MCAAKSPVPLKDWRAFNLCCAALPCGLPIANIVGEGGIAIVADGESIVLGCVLRQCYIEARWINRDVRLSSTSYRVNRI